MPLLKAVEYQGELQRRLTKALFEKLVDEGSIDEPMSGEIPLLLLASNNAYRSLKPLQRWASNESGFPHIIAVAKDVLAVQASSAARDNLLFWS